jgi:spermidine synthase
MMNNDCYTSSFTGSTVAKGWSDFHFYEFIHHDQHGLCLFLDGVLQSAENDQHVYHEKLVRAALEEQPFPDDVLIIGGTGGGVLHHLYRFVDPSNCRVTIVDIDQKLFVTGRKIMRAWNQQEFDHPNVEIVFANGTDYLRQVTANFDVIIIDVGDPIPATRSNDLYSAAVLCDLGRSLRSDGIVAFHSPLERTSEHVFISESLQGNNTLQKISHFPVNIASFERTWMFNTLKKHSL